MRPVRAARRLRRHRRRHVGRHPTAGRGHPGRPDRHPQRRGAGSGSRGDGADHHADRPLRIRPHPAHRGQRSDDGQRSDGDRGTHRRDALATRDPRSQRRRLRLRHRRVAVGTEPAELQQRPTGALPHRRRLDPAPGRRDRARAERRRQRVGGRRQQPRAAGSSWAPNSTAGLWPRTKCPASPSSIRPPPGSTST